MCQFCQRFQVGNFAQRIGRGFQKQQFGIVFNRGFPFVQIGWRYMADFDAELSYDIIDKTDSRTKQTAAGNNMITSLQEGKKRCLNRGHTGRSGYRALCAFQCSNAFFKSGSSRIGCTGIGKAFNFFGKQICRMLCAFPHEAAGQKQRLIVFTIFGLLFAAPDGQRLRMKFFVHLFSNLLCIPMDGTIFSVCLTC